MKKQNIFLLAAMILCIGAGEAVAAGPLSITSFTDQLNGEMGLGETNTLTVVIRNASGLATGVSSVLLFTGDSGSFTIISDNAPVSLSQNSSVTNTYKVIANIMGAYRFTTVPTADNASGFFAQIDLNAGRKISFDSYSISNDKGGIYPGVVEPGETFDLTITSINDGKATITGITNSLASANSTYFPLVTPITGTVYPSMAFGDTETTTYRVKCASTTPNGLHSFTVVNKTADNTWSGTFGLDVFARADISISPSPVTLSVAPGEISSTSVTLINGGNLPDSFTITDNGQAPILYTAKGQSMRQTDFGPVALRPDSVFSNWSGTATEPMPIGFEFSLYGTQYDSFSVSQSGFLTLNSTNGATAEVKVFKTTVAADQATVRYLSLTDRLVVAWGNGTEQEFQVLLNTDGTIHYLYEYGIWGDGEIGLSNAKNSQLFTHTPGEHGMDALKLTSEPWVSMSPLDGSIDKLGATENVTITADATHQSNLGTHSFVATVNWSTGSVDVPVNVVVEAENAKLDVPTPFAFTGPAGQISSPATLTVSNSGNVALSYSITDTGFANTAYTSKVVDYQWRHIPPAADFIVDESQLDIDPIEIGFPFMYKEITYTSLVVGVNGVTLGSKIFMPFVAEGLSLNDESSIRVLTDVNRTRFTVTWENISLSGERSDLTYQMVLYRDGSIRYNYQLIGAEGGITFDGKLITQEDVLRRLSLEVVPETPRIITFSPAFGTIPLGETADITLIGDARSLTGDGINDVSTGTTLTFNYGGTKSAAVTFKAMNSVETAFGDPVAMWGTENPVVSSTQNSEGFRTLSWPSAGDSLRRTYTIWYTTRLGDLWKSVATIANEIVYVDDDPVRNAEPVIFYRVTVE